MAMQDEKLRKLQMVEFDLLKTFKRICDKYHLSYFLSAGTLLGAVRHKGFIPWDDDVDVAMPRPDYERFLVVAKKELAAPYYLDVRENSAAPWAKLENTSMRVKTEMNYNDQVWYAWIDIWPMDAMPSNPLHYFIRKLHICFRQKMYVLSECDNFVNRWKKRSAGKRLLIEFIHSIHLAKLFNSDRQLEKWIRVLKKYPYEKGKYIGNLMGEYKFKYMKAHEIYEPGKELMFEGEMFRVPEHYDVILTSIYGDYMKLPPEDERGIHKIEILDSEADMDKPYEIGYTQGVFDMFHIGHLNLLNRAKELCNYLIVGANTDRLVQEYKNKSPVIGELDRKAILESIRCVDRVLLADTLDKTVMWNELHFNAVFIGDDWKGNDRWAQTEHDLQELGVDVIFLPYTPNVSSMKFRQLRDGRIDD